MHSETFGEMIKRLRKENQLSLRAVAAQIDFDQSTLSKVERNETMAPPHIVQPLAKALKQDYRELQVKYLSEKLFYFLKDKDYALEALQIAERRLKAEHSGTTFKVQRELLIEKIKSYLQDQPIEKAWLFGSFARAEESLDSDIDLLVRFEKPKNLDLFEYIGLMQDLEDLTGRQVDLIEEGRLIPSAEKQAELEKILIYDSKTK